MKSSIVRAQVFHRRFFPESHRFRYPVLYFCLDLDELERIDRDVGWFAWNGPGVCSIHDSDYLDGSKGAIKSRLLAFLCRAGMGDGIHRIMMITSARLLFQVFNPVSFYYCLDREGRLVCNIAEVNNTFGERHLYILKPDRSGGNRAGTRYNVSKEFHVSPFNRVEGVYEFNFGSIDHGVDITITLRVDGQRKFMARLRGDHRPMTGTSLVNALGWRPLMPHLTMARILKEAGVLYFKKRLPYVPKPVDTSAMTIHRKPSNSLQKLCMRVFFVTLRRIRQGSLRITLPDGSIKRYGDPQSHLKADMVILDYDLFPELVLKGDIGLGDAYMKGLFETEDLASLLGVLILAFSGGVRPKRVSAFTSGVLARLIMAGERNSLPGSRKNIRRHYDLSNAFFRLFLDTSMTYSCALFQGPNDDLETAQQRKLASIIDKADITRADHVLEIGSGWGSFAVAAVRQTGCRVTTITLSRKQFSHVEQLVRGLGLDDRISVLFKDYRTMTGTFDKIVSIEMLEAVGHEYLGTFFRRCNELLKPDGRVAIQVITIPDQEYSAYRLRLDWIQKHIFPGGHLPSLTAMCAAMTKHSSLIVDHLENIGPHYADTLRHWHDRFLANLDRVRELGYDETFILKWTYYLKSCEAMFRNRGLQNLQLVLTRPYGRTNSALKYDAHYIC